MSRHAALLFGIVLALAAQAAAAPTRVRIVVGNQHRIPLEMPVVRIATGDPSVAHVQLVDDRELLALGRRVGRTNLIVWLADGSILDLALRVERDLYILATALRGIHPEIRVDTIPDRDAVALRGTVPDVRFSRAAEAMAREYLAGSRGLGPRGERGLVVRADGAAESQPDGGGPGAEGAGSESLQDASIYLPGAVDRARADVVNLIQVEDLPPLLEERIADAIRPLGGERVEVRRIVSGPMPDDENDSFILEGPVSGQVALVRVLLAAARVVTGGDASAESIRVLADEGGGLGGGQGTAASGGGLGTLSGFQARAGNSFGGGGGGGGLSNALAANVARAKALSVAGGRVLAFLDAEDIPQLRLQTRIYEVDRSRLRSWTPNLSVLVGDVDDVELLPLPTAFVSQGENALGVTQDEVLGALSLIEGGTVLAGAQYVGSNVAIDATFQLLENEQIARALARPTLLVMNGETASFAVGGQIPIDVTVDTTVSATSGQLLSSTFFQQFGVDVSVRPHVDENDMITLDIAPNVTQPDFALTADISESTGDGQSTVSFESRSLRTSSRLRDGQTVLLAGFLQSTLSRESDFTPQLHRVPGLGWLFKSKDRQVIELDFVIAITPAIVRDRQPLVALWAYPSELEVLDLLAEPAASQGSTTQGSTRQGEEVEGGERRRAPAPASNGAPYPWRSGNPTPASGTPGF